MPQILVAYFAGILTVLAPCILPLLPVVIGGASASEDNKKPGWYHPVIITSSLAISVILFTLLLRASTSLLGVPQQVWSIVSGLIVLVIGITFLIPNIWARLMVLTRFEIFTNESFAKGMGKGGILRDISIGAALGPVFSSCSPTYALIVALVLPTSLATGLVYLSAYAIGLATIMFGLAYMGNSLVKKLRWLTDPNGWFKKVVGVIFIVVGLVVILGLDKDIQTFVLEQGWYAPIESFEQKLNF